MQNEPITHIPHQSKDEAGAIHVVVESPRGSLTKLKFEPALGAFKLSRPLPLGIAYPFDWGFVPSTLAEDCDPLDAMVLHQASTWPGIVIPVRPIAVVEVVQSDKKKRDERNDRIIAVALQDPRAGLEDLPKKTRAELEEFFVIAGSATHDEVRVLGWKGPAAATSAIEKAHAAFVERRGLK